MKMVRLAISIFNRYLILVLLFPATLVAEPLFQPLGKDAKQASPQSAWNLTITPDGKNLPAGHGNAQQGEQLFKQHCASCHGFGAIGASAMPLVGDVGSLTEEYPEKTVNSYWPYATTLYDYIRRAMPPSAPFSLTSNEIYALCAYILNQDDILKNDVELNEVTLPQVKMPNRDGFSPVYPNKR